MKKVLGTVVALALIGGLCGTATAQRQAARGPLITMGTQELGIQGNLTFDDPQGKFATDLAATYGYFIADNLEIGGKGGYSRFSTPAGSADQLTLGVFGELHFPVYGMTVPYLGLDLDWAYTDPPGSGTDSSAVASPKVGVKWFVRDYFAIDTNMFYRLATDDIFTRDGRQRDTDWGAQLGLRVLFR
jgi:hypothetical protein